METAEGWENKTAGRTESSWFREAPALEFQPLGKDVRADVAVVGGGIAGMTCAYLLCREGKKVVVIDDGNVGSGETGRTTAHATCALDDRYYSLEERHGQDGARLAAASHGAAIDAIESISSREGIDCDFERLDGFLFLDPSDRQESLRKELEATRRAGIATELVARAPLGSFDTGPCIRFPRQGQFQPLKYLAGVGKAIMQNGGEVYTQTHADRITLSGVATSGGLVAAQKIIVATNAPIVDRTSRIYNRQIAYRTCVIAASIEKGTVAKALYWDTGNHRTKNAVAPYHYVRLQELEGDHDLLIVGGEDYKVGAGGEKKRYARLESWAKKRFPIGETQYRWSGQVQEPLDGLAFIGHNPGDRDNVFIATGDSGNGITHGTIAGMLLTDLILGRKNEWAALYDPARKMKKPYSAGPQAWSPAKKKDKKQVQGALARIRAGSGLVIERRGDGPIAAYRDQSGTLHSYSAVCTHLGCTVAWNDAEKSFDCACHGSRFSYAGRAVNGPAGADLAKQRDKGKAYDKPEH